LPKTQPGVVSGSEEKHAADKMNGLIFFVSIAMNS
jgi:hypothetical protein